MGLGRWDRQGGAFLCISNTTQVTAAVKVMLLFEDGTTSSRWYVVTGSSRFSVSVKDDFPLSVGKRFGALVESSTIHVGQLVVEWSMYSDAGGIKWAAGANTLGTLLR